MASENPLANFNLVLQPATLLLDYSIFAYLLFLYQKQWKDPWVFYMIFISALCFLSLFFYAYPDKNVVANLNDVSEGSSVITFLLRIIMIGKGINVQLKIKSISALVYASKFLTIVYSVDVFMNVISVFHPIEWPEEISESLENTSMLFIVFFRFYVLAQIEHGWKNVMMTRNFVKLSLCMNIRLQLWVIFYCYHWEHFKLFG